MKSIQAQLEELGLGEKEVKIYLASLELGSATVQQIAAKSAIVRASAYVAIGGLTKHGLMSTYTKGKKKYFTAEPPEQLLKLLQEKRRKLVEQESKLKQAMPELQALISLSADKPEVKYYEGLEGLEAMREKIFESKAKELFVIAAPEKMSAVVSEESRVIHNLRLKRTKIRGRFLAIIGNRKIPEPLIKFDNWDYRMIKRSKLNFSAEISIFGKYLTLISYQDKPYGFLVKSHDIAELGKILFESTWSKSEKFPWQ